MEEYGFIKVGACVPELKVANPKFNTEVIKKQIDLAIKNNIGIITFSKPNIF